MVLVYVQDDFLYSVIVSSEDMITISLAAKYKYKHFECVIVATGEYISEARGEEREFRPAGLRK